MDTKEELLPFIKEMLQQKPTRQMVKIYAIGSTLAVLGAIGAVIQSIFRSEEYEDTSADMIMRDTDETRAVPALTSEAQVQRSGLEKTKGEPTLWEENRRTSANRQHAS
ncbi:G0/G1 switch protein 2 [Boleophthalmus pectinirostris]|uniref:G0/G1 switch protein 2 n=1 Tax=Boleophthalmus pectinirostris TaxID=150288 RepID=UPI00242BE869|nr:G0/G1 switch protein 2 [Boleophthalmus pectinirostris]